MMVGDTFHRSGLAVALQKDSAWTEKISLQILKMRETGEMEQLDRDWIIIASCERGNNKPSTLGTLRIFRLRLKFYIFGIRSRRACRGMPTDIGR